MSNPYEYKDELDHFWIWENPNGHAARGEIFVFKSQAEEKYKNCNGKAVRLVKVGGRAFVKEAKAYLTRFLKGKL